MCTGSKSQSTKSIGYTFGYSTAEGGAVNFHVVDTPGLSDTQGENRVVLYRLCHMQLSSLH